MILSLHDAVDASGQSPSAVCMASSLRNCRRCTSGIRPAARSAISGPASRSSWRGASAKRLAPSHRNWPARSGRSRASRAWKRRQRLPQLLSRSRAQFALAHAGSARPRARRRPRARQDHRRAHGHQPEQGRAHRTSAQRRAGRHAGARAAVSRPRRSRCRTTSTTPACRSPTSSSASGSSKARALADVRAIADPTRFDYYCWDLYARVTEWYEGDKAAPRDSHRHAARHRAGDNDPPTLGAFIADRIVRCHLKTMAPAERRLRPADVGGRHPAAAVLGRGLRDSQGARRGVPADRRPARRAAGSCGSRTTTAERAAEPAPVAGAADEEAEAARESHRALERHRHVRRQGHREPVLEVRAARQGLPLPRLRDARAEVRSGRPRRPTAPTASVPAFGGTSRRLQRHRHASGVSAAAAEAGAGDDGLRRSRREQSMHFSYEMVALSHATARELGYESRRARPSRSSRCPAARASASRPTICSTG